MTILRTIVACAGVVVAFALVGLGGLWGVLGIALFVCAVDLMPEWTT